MFKFLPRTFRSGLVVGGAFAVAVAAAAIAYDRYDTQTLKRTLRRGELLCGVNTGLPGFSAPDDKGRWSGFDVDFCRAIAAAIFDDPNKVRFVPLEASERFTSPNCKSGRSMCCLATRPGACRAKRITR
jgi:general L-amino acid transport system substrate-binding protein